VQSSSVKFSHQPERFWKISNPFRKKSANQKERGERLRRGSPFAKKRRGRWAVSKGERLFGVTAALDSERKAKRCWGL